MKEDEEVACALCFRRIRLSIRDVVKFHSVSDLEEGMFKALDRLFGEIPELVSCCRTFSSGQCDHKQRTYG